jgi:hypothetical protein
MHNGHDDLLGLSGDNFNLFSDLSPFDRLCSGEDAMQNRGFRPRTNHRSNHQSDHAGYHLHRYLGFTRKLSEAKTTNCIDHYKHYGDT